MMNVPVKKLRTWVMICGATTSAIGFSTSHEYMFAVTAYVLLVATMLMFVESENLAIMPLFEKFCDLCLVYLAPLVVMAIIFTIRDGFSYLQTGQLTMVAMDMLFVMLWHVTLSFLLLCVWVRSPHR